MKSLLFVKLAAYFCLLLCTPAVQRPTLAARAADDPALASPGALVSKPALGTESLPNGLSADDWTNIRAAYEAGRHAACATEGGYRAHNSGQQWTTHFDGQGFITSPDSGGWTWGLQLEAYGWGGAEPVVAGCAAMTAEGQRVSYAWDDRLTEWYLNDQRGLEHGFTIRSRPGDATGQLALELAVRGDLLPEVSNNGRDVRFIDATGISILHYAGLTVFDCDDQPLAANWIVVNERLRLQIEDREAHYPLSIDPIAQQAYLKAHNTDPADQFGNAVAVSGNTVIIGARGENNPATGVNPGVGGGPQAALSGAAYIFVRNETTWTQQAYLKASNTGASDIFGCSVAISGDTAVVGAFGEASSATGVNGDQSNNLATRAGAAYVFLRSGTTWTQQAYLKASNTGAWDFFGDSVAISGDTLVVGASGEGSAASVVNGDQSNDAAPSAGAAYVFVRSGTTWTQEAYLKASNAELVDLFGQSITIWGDTIVVGAPEEDSASTGVNGDQSSAAANASGAVYVFVRTGTIWAQQAYIKASNAQASDSFGGAVALSDSTLVVGASNESSAATGVGGDQSNNSAHLSGAAYVFVRNGNTWTQQAYLKASNTDPDDDFGVSVSVSGETVVVGAREEASSSTGLNGDQSIDAAPAAGAAYVFARKGTVWSQTAYLKASNAEQDDFFGASVAVAGNIVLVGAPREDSGAKGVNGPQDNNAVLLSGAAYLFDLDAQPDPWTNLGLGLAGAGGVPLLIGTGEFTAGSAISLRVQHAAPTAPGFLVLGLSAINLPLLGGILVPSPDLLFSLSTSATGGVQTHVPVPVSFPPGIALFAQGWILDAGAVSGWAATNALTATSL